MGWFSRDSFPGLHPQGQHQGEQEGAQGHQSYTLINITYYVDPTKTVLKSQEGGQRETNPEGDYKGEVHQRTPPRSTEAAQRETNSECDYNG